MEDCLNLVKTVSKTEVAVGDIVTYKIHIINKSEHELKDIVIRDLIPEYCEFILGSVTINKKVDLDFNIISGVHIESLKIDNSKVITYDVKILKNPNQLTYNKSIAEYIYSDSDEIKFGYTHSNTCEIFIVEPILHVGKVCDKKDLLLNEVLNYSIKITNNGELDFINLFMVEEIPDILEFVSGSFSLNGSIVYNVDLKKGILLGDIKPDECIYVKYSLKVISSSSYSTIKTITKISSKYLTNDSVIKIKEDLLVDHTLNVPLSTFKSISLDDYIQLEPCQLDILEINNLTVSAKINTYHVINTPVSKSSEGQLLSGHKLIVHGNLTQVLEYVSDYRNKSINTISFDTNFSSYIVLPPHFHLYSKLEVDTVVENIYYSKSSSRSFFENITLLLISRISPGDSDLN